VVGFELSPLKQGPRSGHTQQWCWALGSLWSGLVGRPALRLSSNWLSIRYRGSLRR
jgi:hypothetical protein